MLTDLDLHSYLGEDFLTPATIEEFTEDSPQSISPMSDEYSLFSNNNTLDYKPTHTSYSSESPDAMTSPTQSTQPDLLDLESFTYFLQNPEKAEGDWLPPAHLANEDATNENTTNEKTAASQPAHILKSTGKRKSSTTEIELQIEIEESTKRAKRCTAPLTEEQKRLRRKELNRLAAQRCRSKRKSHGEILEEEIAELTEKNRQLREKLEQLESTKNELYDVIKYHFASCHSK